MSKQNFITRLNAFHHSLINRSLTQRSDVIIIVISNNNRCSSVSSSSSRSIGGSCGNLAVVVVDTDDVTPVGPVDSGRPRPLLGVPPFLRGPEVVVVK